MRVIDYGRLLLLAALWGASFVYAHHHPGLRGDDQRFFFAYCSPLSRSGCYSACSVNGAGIRENSYPLCSWGSLIQAFLFSCTALPRNGCRQGTPPRLTPRRR